MIPYNLLNYLLGAYPVKLWHFLIANFAMIPGIVVYVYVGSAVSSIGALFNSPSGGNLVHIIVFTVGIIFAVGAIILIMIYTKKQLKKIMDESNDRQNSYNDDEVDLENRPNGDEILHSVNRERNADFEQTVAARRQIHDLPPCEAIIKHGDSSSNNSNDDQLNRDDSISPKSSANVRDLQKVAANNNGYSSKPTSVKSKNRNSLSDSLRQD